MICNPFPDSLQRESHLTIGRNIYNNNSAPRTGKSLNSHSKNAWNYQGRLDFLARLSLAEKGAAFWCPSVVHHKGGVTLADFLFCASQPSGLFVHMPSGSSLFPATEACRCACVSARNETYSCTLEGVVHGRDSGVCELHVNLSVAEAVPARQPWFSQRLDFVFGRLC